MRAKELDVEAACFLSEAFALARGEVNERVKLRSRELRPLFGEQRPARLTEQPGLQRYIR